MNIENLSKRAEYLKEQLKEFSAKVSNLSTQLQQATSQMHVMSGHLNEAMFLLVEAQKEGSDSTVSRKGYEEVISE